jgi:predicted MFS family arabinose efflux permease
MLGFAMSAVAVAPILTLVALGTIAGNVLGGWLGDRLSKPAVFVVAQLTAGFLGFALFGGRLAFPAAVAVATLVALANSVSRPGFLAYGSGLAPGQRGALFGLVALSNQIGAVIGTAVGAAIIGDGNYSEFALVTLAQGGLAAAFALPLLRRRS